MVFGLFLKSLAERDSEIVRKPSRISFRGGVALAQGVNSVETADEDQEGTTSKSLVSRILAARGFDSREAINSFLSPTLQNGLRDPFGIKDIDKAIEYILDAVRRSLSVTIFTDFDVDGLTSGAQLYLALKAIGANVSCYTPNRFSEGYGLSRLAVHRIVEAKTGLLITVDCGITSREEVALAKRQGLNVIILDHHLPQGEVPNADAIINPKQDGCTFVDRELSAAGLVWLLVVALRTELKKKTPQLAEKIDPKEYLDLAALGTICDMVPLVGLNRVIAHRGLEAIARSERPGIIALKKIAGLGEKKEISAGHVGFQIGPRINAVGRMGDASEVLELLITEDSNVAKRLAESTEFLNRKRKQIEDEVRKECMRQVRDGNLAADSRAFAIYSEEFHLGVIGIAAQRVVEQFTRPACVMCPAKVEENGKVKLVIKGSVRSIEGFHVAQILAKLDEHLLSHGGHAKAGGFSLLPENLQKFSSAFIEIAEQTLSEDDCCKEVSIDTVVTFAELTHAAVEELTRLAPFGIGNPTPVFLSRNVEVISVSSIMDSHLKVRFKQGKQTVESICWDFRGHPLLTKGRIVDIAYTPEINKYQGISAVQLSLKEVWN